MGEGQAAYSVDLEPNRIGCRQDDIQWRTLNT